MLTLTIGQLAKHVGVTVKAVRHYHRLGLLPEPDRDCSDYRRYDARAVVQLTRIKVLRDAGIPLRDIPDLLQADACTLAEAADQIERDLDAQIEVLRRRKEQVRLLTAGEGLYLPEEVVGYLDYLRTLGIPDAIVDLEHDGWVIWSVTAPDDVARWAREKHQNMTDPTVMANYLEFMHVATWDPDDPRIDDLAARTADRYLAEAEKTVFYRELMPRGESVSSTLDVMQDRLRQTSPSLARLNELIFKHVVASVTDAPTATPPWKPLFEM